MLIIHILLFCILLSYNQHRRFNLSKLKMFNVELVFLISQLFKPFHSDRLSNTYQCNKYRIVLLYVKGWPVIISIKMINVCPCRLFFIKAIIVDLGETLPYVAFDMGYHCLPSYVFTGIQMKTVNCYEYIF